MITLKRLVLRTLRHYTGAGMATMAGIAITTAVICGALIIGNSLQNSLLQTVQFRLGNSSHTITAGERLFTAGLAERLNRNEKITAASILKTEAIAAAQGGEPSVNKVQVWGIDTLFGKISGFNGFEIENGEAIINKYLASKLDLEPGDFFMLRVRYTGPIPANTPFVSEAGQSISRRVKVKSVIGKEEAGDFNLQSTQSAPLNLFVNITWLNRIMNLDGKSNIVLINDEGGHSPDELKQMARVAWQIGDGNLEIEYFEDSGSFQISSERVFIDDYMAEELTQLFPEAEQHLTYFANSIQHKDQQTPYSFVTALRRSEPPFKTLASDEAVINRWLADDLKLNVGDTLKMTWFVVGPMRELTEESESFVVAAIINMDEAEADKGLIPHLPGLSDAGSCAGWDAGIPINLDLIRQKDEDYWDEYKGTPKVYISVDRGRELWQNRFGNLTGITAHVNGKEPDHISQLIQQRIDPFRLGFQLNEVREQGIRAARGGVDFSQLFAGLGVFIIISGLLLTLMMLYFNLKKRRSQIELFTSLGFSQQLINKILLSEAFIITVAGALLGLLLSLGYSKLVFAGLNRIWYDIVRTDTLNLHVSFATLATGLLVSILAGMLVIFFGIRKVVRENTRQRLTPITEKLTKKRSSSAKFTLILSALLFAAALSISTYLFLNSLYSDVMWWFAAGISLLLSLILGIHHWLNRKRKQSQTRFTLNVLSLSNIRRNPLRSFTIATLLASGSFVIVVTAANHKQPDPATDRSGGTGGFLLMAETTVPILKDLNMPEARLDYDLPDDIQFVQFFSGYDDDASCLNLNRVENPRIIATNPANLDGRFTFVSTTPHLNPQNPWLSLNSDIGDLVPAIADQSVIQWGLGKRVGDTLIYLNQQGEEIRLLLIGGIANSVFQGNVIISEEQFLKHFPAIRGADIILAETQVDEPEELMDDLNFIFRDYGWNMIKTRDKLAEFNSVENTYLSIFFLMGAFAMLLGTVGFAVLIAKAMVERRNEISLMNAIGFRKRLVFRLFFNEFTALFIIGIITGTVAAVVATMPSFIQGNQNVSSLFLFSVLGVLVLNGLFWTGFIIKAMIGRITATINEE